jgi:hypothetical protein
MMAKQKKKNIQQACSTKIKIQLVTHACNPSYLGGTDPKDQGWINPRGKYIK